MAETGIEFNRIDIMTLEPLLNASTAVQVHVATVTPAALIGAALFLMRKGTPVHRLLGRVWMALMAITSISTFFIHEIDLLYGFSPIHLLSIFVLFGIWQAIAAARRRDIRRHRSIVLGMYFGGIVVAGLFTLLPGRIMNAVVFSGQTNLAPIVIALLLIAATLFYRRLRARQI